MVKEAGTRRRQGAAPNRKALNAEIDTYNHGKTSTEWVDV